MSDRTFVDLENLIRDGGVVAGCVPVADVPELSDRLASRAGVVSWRLQARRDAHARIGLTLWLEGELVMQCQRCLGDMSYPLSHRWELSVVRAEADLPELGDEDEEVDCIVVPQALDVVALVVEELLLALPMMPRHEGAECHGSEGGTEGERASPFAVLRPVRAT